MKIWLRAGINRKYGAVVDAAKKHSIVVSFVQLLSKQALPGSSPNQGEASTLKRDTALVVTSLREKEGNGVTEECLHEQLEEFLQNGQIQQHFDLDSVQMERIEKATGPARIVALAGAIRTQNFMENYRSSNDVLTARPRSAISMRYRQELRNRDANMKSLRRKWSSECQKPMDSEELMQREALEFQKIALCWGWNSSMIEDNALDDLIKRAQIAKEATENGKSVDWSTVKYSTDSTQ